MKNIIKSLAIIVAVAAVAGGATYAYFSDTATVSGNTFATGTLSIEPGDGHCQQFYGWHDHQGWHREDHGCPQNKHCENYFDNCAGITKFKVENAQPGNCKTKEVEIKNTGTLTARDLRVDWKNKSGDVDLCNALTVKYNGAALATNIAGTITPHHDMKVPIEVCFPDNGQNQNALQHKTCSFDLEVVAKAYGNDEME